MSEQPDEAMELAREAYNSWVYGDTHETADESFADLLRPILAERDAARAETLRISEALARCSEVASERYGLLKQAESERDALREERDRMHKALTTIVKDNYSFYPTYIAKLALAASPSSSTNQESAE